MASALPLAPRRRPAKGSVTRAAALALAGAVLGAACGSSAYTYVSSPAAGAYFRIPRAWHLFDEAEIRRHNGEGPASEDDEFRYLAIFDADPEPSLDHDLETAAQPFGLVRVRELAGTERDGYSLASLRNEMIPVDRIAGQDNAQVRDLAPPVSVEMGRTLAGTRLVYAVEHDGLSYAVHQVGLLDRGTRVVYFFLVGCRLDCFEANRATIDAVARSWTVEEP